MIYHFGNFILDVEKHELKRDGVLVPVEPQVFALLVHLVREQRRVVSKDELIEAIWEGRFVSDSAVSSRIKSARQALGDDGQAQRFIKTVHGKGFRFVAEVREADDETPFATASSLASQATPAAAAPANAAPQAAASTPRNPVRTLSKRTGITLAAFAVLALAGLLFLFIPGGGQAAIDQSRFALLPTQNVTGTAKNDWAELGLMSLASDRIAKLDGLNVVSPGKILDLVGQMDAHAASSLTLPEDMVSKLRAQGASHIVLSRLSQADGLFRLDFALLSPDGGRQVASVGGEKIAELADMMVRRVVALVPGGSDVELARNRLFDDPFVSEAYARGLAFELVGKVEEARNLFAVASTQDPDSIWLRYEYALCTRKMGLFDEAEAQLLALRAEAEQRQDDEAHASILNALGVLDIRRQNTQRAIGHLEAALPISQRLKDRARTGTILVNLGILERRTGNFAKAETHLTRAFAEFDAAGITPPPGSLLNTMALLRYEQGELTEARTYMERALERFGIDGDGRALGAVLKNLADMRNDAGDYDGALALHQESFEQRLQVDDPLGLESSLGALAQITIRMGQLDKAEAHARALLKSGETRDDLVAQGRGHAYLGDLYRYRLDAAFARQHYQRAMDLFTQAKREKDVMRVRVDLALTDLLAGDKTAAAQQARRTRDWAMQDGAKLELMTAETALGQIAWDSGDRPQAEAHYRAALVAARDLPAQVYRGRVLCALGLVSLERGDRDAAERFAAAAEKFAPNDVDLYRLQAGLARADGKPDEAVNLMERAKALAGERWSREDETSLAALKAV